MLCIPGAPPLRTPNLNPEDTNPPEPTVYRISFPSGRLVLTTDRPLVALWVYRVLQSRWPASVRWLSVEVRGVRVG